MKDLRAGTTVQHYKGGFYEIVCLARASTTLETLVVYRALDGESQVWTREIGEFSGPASVGNRLVPRFSEASREYPRDDISKER